MAEDKGSKTFQELDKEAIKAFNERVKYEQERQAKMVRQWEWRGNKLPPFNIQPQPFERQRLATPMTPEQRLARKQWLQDQHLAPNEPRYVPELQPMNIIRRTWAAPWNAMYHALRPAIGLKGAMFARVVIPKALVSFVVMCAMWYNVKYTPSSWEAKKGWHFYSNKDVILPGDPRWPNEETRESDDFCDKGFKSRKSHAL